jgi:glycosyltransferase involved in cell wall biosynthesis
MNKTLFSIVIPAYNNAQYLPDAINSVLQQTYPHFELIVVDDASPDNAADVIRSFADPRVRYIKHEVNKGLSAARNTGIMNAVGNYIALLDGDDYFHNDKLKAHAEFLEKNPDVDVTYNARFELNHSAKTIREMWRPPTSVSLGDLVAGFPFGPSDMVVQRDLALRIKMFDEYFVYVGEDLDFNCRLALAGAKFASVNRSLNYRRYHSGRKISSIPYFVDSTFRAMKAAFADPRCPPEVLALQEKAFASHYILWSAIAFTQDDTALGQEYCLAAIKGNPSYLSGRPSQLLNTLISFSIVDENLDHEELLPRMLAQLPSEVSGLAEQSDWAVGRGYLLRFVRAMMWDRPADAQACFEKACSWQARVDQAFLQHLSTQILSYQMEFGKEKAGDLLKRLTPYLEQLGSQADVQSMKDQYWINDAFYNYSMKEYDHVPGAVLGALFHDPSTVRNRGLIKIFLNSLMKR